MTDDDKKPTLVPDGGGSHSDRELHTQWLESYGKPTGEPDSHLPEDIPTLTEVVREGKQIPDQPRSAPSESAHTSYRFPPYRTHQPEPVSPQSPHQPAPQKPSFSQDQPPAPFDLTETVSDDDIPIHDLSDFDDYSELEFSVDPEVPFDPLGEPPESAWPAWSPDPAISPSLPSSAPREQPVPGSLPRSAHSRAVVEQVIADLEEQIRESLEVNLKRQLDTAVDRFLESYAPRIRRIARNLVETSLDKIRRTEN